MDRCGPAVDLSTSEYEVPRSNSRSPCQYFVSFDVSKIDYRGCISVGFFLGFSVDRCGPAVDLSTSELEVSSSNHRQ